MLAKLGWFYLLSLIILTVSNVVSVILETFKAILMTIFKKKSEIGLCVIRDGELYVDDGHHRTVIGRVYLGPFQKSSM
ncbi:hypothetical protein VCR5J5_1330024 [Vibrio crassostreae]|uniref:Uncharacterized protein n=1 Tax=Vibrio crassostreae TaxID=246167 RepID=A0A822MMU7_9VIBR|nr:hypothetical protein VCR5J5_1330024 [Vibrio crassostreae]CDT67613.1 hypothetical protein VCR9J2_850002 [Vibrio crassostreae]